MASYHAPLPLALLTPPSKSEWGSLLDVLPSSFDLVSPGQMARQGLELLSNAANARRFLAVLTSMQAHLRDASVPVLVQEHRQALALLDHDSLSRSQRRWIGQLALEIYFTQLFRSEVAIVDVWPSRFGVNEDGDAVWSPRPFYLRWDPRFREGLRDVYAGFFLGDTERFEHGMFELGLGSAGHVLVSHFGDGNQRSVRFGGDHLQSTLAAMSNQRKQLAHKLHPNFAAFGIYLVSLHELLGSLDMPFDVRAAFMRSYPGNPHK